MKRSKDNQIVVYSDGAGNKGKIGWAFVILEKGIHIVTGQGSKSSGTNNIAELKGVIAGLMYCNRKFKGRPVKVISDSQYVVFAITRRWLKNWKRNNWRKSNGTLKNIILWKTLDMIINRIGEENISFEWVRGHDGNEYNEIADSMAEEAKEFNINKITILENEG